MIHLIDDAQAVRLYGFSFSVKRTLTWLDVLECSHINLRACIAAGVHPEKLHRLQPDIKEWIRSGKATLADARLMGPWRPNPFTDLDCKIADLVLHRDSITPQVLIDGGVTVHDMCTLHGLSPKLMALLKYTADDWIALDIDAAFIATIDDTNWLPIFGPAVTRPDLLLRVQKRKLLQQAQTGTT